MIRASHHPARSLSRKRQGGFGLIEILVAAAFLAFALLGYVSTTLSGHHLALEERSRSAVLHTVNEFMEALRADEDWLGLYDRLLALQPGAGDASARAAANQPAATADGLRVKDGRVAWAPTAYYPGLLDVPESLTCLVDVPSAMSTDMTERVLREDVSLPAFLLPADLNGDGKVSSSACTNYLALPVVVTFKWTVTGRGERELKVSTWLRRTD